jgi:transposase InsO family protein
VLIELGVVEQRHKAVLEVLDGLPVTEVAGRFCVSRQTVHRWLTRYADTGISGLVDRPSRPASCPHQMAAALEARIVALRAAHPRWGPRTLRHYLACEQPGSLPSRSAIYRCLVRHQLIDPVPRRRRREDYRRWERSRSMELWQMDIMGGVRLTDGCELKIITGIDDHSRFCVVATLSLRATARPVCEALTAALLRYGPPAQILTDNGKVFTARFGPGPGPVLFDRICSENGIRHLLTAPRSPTTTGKVERFHKTVRGEFLVDRRFASLEQAQTELDAWIAHYNAERPHQGIGMAAPARRFIAAADGGQRAVVAPSLAPAPPEAQAPRGAVRRLVGATGKISLCGFEYRVGSYLGGESVAVVVAGGLLEVWHGGVLIASHAARHRLDGAPKQGRHPQARAHSAGRPVLRMVDPYGYISFAGTGYWVGRRHRRQQVEVRLVGNNVEISLGGKLIRTHAAKHDSNKEHGAFALAGGRPRTQKHSEDDDRSGVTEVMEPICNAGGET